MVFCGLFDYFVDFFSSVPVVRTWMQYDRATAQNILNIESVLIDANGFFYIYIQFGIHLIYSRSCNFFRIHWCLFIIHIQLKGFQGLHVLKRGLRSLKEIDHIQHNFFFEIWSPFHGRFTHKTARFCFAKLIKTWIYGNSCFSCIKDWNIPMQSSSFARETDLKFAAVFSVVWCLLKYKHSK